jgi:hypothetical protein
MDEQKHGDGFCEALGGLLSFIGWIAIIYFVICGIIWIVARIAEGIEWVIKRQVAERR